MSRSDDHILGIDASFSGVAGDMFIAALIQLDPQGNEILNGITEKIKQFFGIKDFNVKFLDANFGDFRGLKLQFTQNHTKIEENFSEKFSNFVEMLDLQQKYKKFVQKTIEILLQAEMDHHQTKNPHLHELGTVDTFFDICCIGLLLQSLKVTKVQISSLAIGNGHIKIAHGIVPVPAPATLWILEKYSIATTQGPTGEALTPTGAAIIASLITNFGTAYHVTWIHHALGFGFKVWEDRGNFVRIRLGKSVKETTVISVLETNLDDVTGEILGYTLQKLLDEGALDVSYYPIFMKKNRPGYCLRVLVPNDLVEHLITQIQYLTSTLGIRIFEISRHVGKRRVEEYSQLIQGIKYSFRVKIGPYSSKIEFQDLISIAEKINKSPKETEYLLMDKLNLTPGGESSND